MHYQHVSRWTRGRRYIGTALIAITAAIVTAAFGSASPTTAAAGEPVVVSSADGAQALGGLLPDIIEEIPQHLAIQNQQQREILRFSTTHWNFGIGPLQIRGGGQVAPCIIEGVTYDQCTYATQEILDASGNVVALHPAGVAFFHPEHNHWHQSSVAFFAIRKRLADSPVTGLLGLKTTFCLVDVDKSDSVHANSTRVYFECNGDLQGISVGWGDEYHHSTEGQDLDITGLPAGIYYLTQDADPDNHWLEMDDNNNRSWVKFALSRRGANPSITILETSGYLGNTSNK